MTEKHLSELDNRTLKEVWFWHDCDEFGGVMNCDVCKVYYDMKAEDLMPVGDTSQEDRLQRVEHEKKEAEDRAAEESMMDDDSSEPSNTPDPQATLEPIADLGVGEEY